MQFHSWIFLFAFLPITLLGFYLTNKFAGKKMASYFLIATNFIFYFYAGWQYALYFIGCILFNYIVAQRLLATQKKFFFILGITFNLGALAILKYTNFFISTLNSLFQTDYNLIQLFLPLGLSFFTFQFIALLYDCYKGNVSTLSFTKYLVYTTYFPKIIQGPIMLYQDFDKQYSLEEKSIFQPENVAKGLYILACGFGKKILIADVLGNFVNVGFSSEYTNYNSTMSILLMLAYTFQIYFDFSGYTDMARGISYMLNIELPQNFNSPYKALSINDFWKRWHMSLTGFFTKYLYIPLGGNRKGKLRTYMNVLIIFAFSGLWHGAGLNFIIWGLLHGIASVIERRWKFMDKLHVSLQWMYTFAFVNITWLFFRSGTISQALHIIRNILRCDFSGILQGTLSTLILPEINFIIDLVSFEAAYRILPLAFIGILLLIVLQFKNTDEQIKTFKPTLWKMLFTIVTLTWCILSFGSKITFIYEMF